MLHVIRDGADASCDFVGCLVERFLRAVCFLCHFSEEVPTGIDLQAEDSSDEHSNSRSRSSSSLTYFLSAKSPTCSRGRKAALERRLSPLTRIDRHPSLFRHIAARSKSSTESW